jgi:hypothetical protein
MRGRRTSWLVTLGLSSQLSLAACIPGFASKEHVLGSSTSASSSSGAGGAPLAAHCTNDVKDADETDVDCGGSCDGCALGKVCNATSDCLENATGVNVRCVDGACVPPPKATWQQHPAGTPAPTQRQYARFAYDSARRMSLLWGGYNASGVVVERLWGWDGAIWHDLTPVGEAPPPSATGAFVYDPAVHRAIEFGGAQFVGGMGFVPVPSSTTYEWDGDLFAHINATTPPPPRYNTATAQDLAHDQLVMFGGHILVSGSITQVVDETWLFDRKTMRWIDASTNQQPTKVFGATAAYDAAHARVVLVGGGDGNWKAVDQTWLWDGSTWQPAAQDEVCARRINATMAYDERRKRVVLFSGVQGDQPKPDTVTCEWDGSAWSKVTFAASAQVPPARNYGAMDFDSSRGSIVVTGGTGGATPMDVWEYTALANACKTDLDCDAGGHCVDGLCCGAAQCGACEACNVDAQTAGTCAPCKTCDGSGKCAR